MPHKPVGTNNLRLPDTEDGSYTVPKRRQQTNLRCTITQMHDDQQCGESIKSCAYGKLLSQVEERKFSFCLDNNRQQTALNSVIQLISRNQITVTWLYCFVTLQFYKQHKTHLCSYIIIQFWINTCNNFNLLKTKHKLLYLKTQSVPRSKHFSSRLCCK